MFVNRVDEMGEMRRLLSAARACVTLVGRRRIGKSALAMRVLSELEIPSFAVQAIEASAALQVEQMVEDLEGFLPQGVGVANWQQFFAAMRLVATPAVLFLDELPYLCRADASFSSRLQQFIDKKMPEDLRIVMAGSSQSAMFSQALAADSPLYGRSSIIHLMPMSYRSYCEYLGVSGRRDEDFLIYSLVGGIPRYWQLVRPDESAVDLADRMFMRAGSFFENEILRLLKDEGVGRMAASILNTIGMGSHKPSEIAARMRTPVSNLSRPLELLRQTCLVRRDVPFGESHRHSKRSLYRLADVAVAFWYRSALPHLNRWPSYSPAQKRAVLECHASTVLEDAFREQCGGVRYWEKGLEIDCVVERDGHVDIFEVKWHKLTASQRARLSGHLAEAVRRSRLSGRSHRARVVDRSDVMTMLLEDA